MSKNDKLQLRRDSKYFVIYWFTFQTFRAYGKVSGGITKKKILWKSYDLSELGAFIHIF